MKLVVELVPETCWFKNLRSLLKPAQWDLLRRDTYQKAHHRCEICGGKGKKWPVECHEVWEYLEKKKVQRLVRLIALCPACHEVKHFGFAQINGRAPQALQHLAKVNGISDKKALQHIDDAADTWRKRSEDEWFVDLSWLKEQGIAV